MNKNVISDFTIVCSGHQRYIVDARIGKFKISFYLSYGEIIDWRTYEPGFRIGGKMVKLECKLKKRDVFKWLKSLDIEKSLNAAAKLAKTKMIEKRDRLNKRINAIS